MSSTGIATTYVKVTTTGADGSATGTGTSRQINGFLLDVYLDFHASAPNTTDTTVALATPALGNITVISNTATDALYMPRKNACDIAGAAISGVYDLYPVSGTISVALAGCNALTDAVVATIRYLELG
jgi:hypothetical protein